MHPASVAAVGAGQASDGVGVGAVPDVDPPTVEGEGGRGDVTDWPWEKGGKSVPRMGKPVANGEELGRSLFQYFISISQFHPLF
ncbi:MAG: hypothetical protein AAGF75_03225 [Cyanobacteria bacterium P01_H01_bin.130]